MPKSKGKKGAADKGKKAALKKIKEENVVATAEAASKLWSAKLQVTEKSRLEYRQNANLLRLENERLQKQMISTEKDTIDVIAYLKDQDQKKTSEIEKLQNEIKVLRKSHREENEFQAEEYSRQVNQLEDIIMAKSKEYEKLENELVSVSEFRRKRGQMQRELDEIKEALATTVKEHKIQLENMEQRFLAEKAYLQREANQKIETLAERAHQEALSNLNETTKTVFKDNLRLNKALDQHIKESSVLCKRNNKIETQLTLYKCERDENEVIAQTKTVEVLKNKKEIKELQDKVMTLETTLIRVAQKFADERQLLQQKNVSDATLIQSENSKLHKILEMKINEARRIKFLARNILSERSDIEVFFLEALDYVRSQILANQENYLKDAKIAYTRKMLEATAGKSDYPKIRTFRKTPASTNNVFTDVETAGNIADSSAHVDVSDLTWEQKERVLRYLFASMNGLKASKMKKLKVLPPIEDKKRLSIMDCEDNTFITNQQPDIQDQPPISSESSTVEGTL